MREGEGVGGKKDVWGMGAVATVAARGDVVVMDVVVMDGCVMGDVVMDVVVMEVVVSDVAGVAVDVNVVGC